MLIKSYPYAWNLTDFATIPQNGIKVMSTFACGGGSSMGYKRAGCTIIAANDIDPQMASHYKKNIGAANYFLCPIRDLLTASLPKDLYNLDILDGSPPCSTFSMAGNREKNWGQKKHFREGQAEQVLSDLFFDYLDLVEHLKPKVAIAENVKGMIMGNAKGYTKLITEKFKQIGYRPQLFLLNSADCGVPQTRERLFFCAVREDISNVKLALRPSHKWISAGEACADLANLTQQERKHVALTPHDAKCWHGTLPGKSYAEFNLRTRGKGNGFSVFRLSQQMPSRTLTAKDGARHWSECRLLTFREWKRLGSFPDDYIAESETIGKYMIGMSVPPKMTEQVARAVIDQWLLPYNAMECHG